MAFTPTEEAQLRAVITAFESGKTILEIAASTEVFTTDVLEVVQSAVSKKATVAQIITLVNSELGIVSMSTKLSGIEAGAQVNKIEGIQKNGVDLTITGKKVNITVPTTASEIGAQPAGTYATGTGTANGTNTGDETLTSIKTKLGAATSVSDGYLKYQDFALLHTPTTVTAANGLSISGQNISLQNASLSQSGALTFNDWNTFNSKEPAITKKSGFNLPLGTTTGTVLEGRTFGTAANSAVGDFQPTITGLTTSYIPKWNGSTFVNATAGTDYQLPITLTTNGTSGAATFSGNVLNVPNYTSSGGVDQTQTTVNGSTGGNMVCSMPFQTGSYKKVLIILNNFVGDAVYTLPTPFVNEVAKKVYVTNVSVGTTVSYGNTAVYVTATLGNGAIIVEGY